MSTKLLWVQDPSYDWCRIVVHDGNQWVTHHYDHNHYVDPALLMNILLDHLTNGGIETSFHYRWIETECDYNVKLDFDALWEAAEVRV